MLLIALGLIATMAIISNTTYRIHADELDHVAAARFYLDNWLPPAVADPRTLDSYSYGGFSYLNEWDIVYLLAGKFGRLVNPILQNEVYAFRSFNVLLFMCLTCMAWFRRDEILMFSVLLLSPQIWYLFSYFNADAFPIFLSFLAAYELTSSRSAFNDRTRSLAARYLRLGLYIGLIILSKKTFWMFAVFTVGYVALVELWHSSNRDWRACIWRTCVLAMIACAVALPRIAYDVYINGPPSQKAQKLGAIAELLADDDFKPSRYGSNRFSNTINLKSRGVGFFEMIRSVKRADHSWISETQMTAFGVYYYLIVYGPAFLYNLAAGCVLLLAAVLSLSIVWKGNAHDKVTLALSAACCLGIAGLSLLHSWMNDFQPQGRYLFAAFTILGILLVNSRQYLDSRFTTGVIVASFVLSSWSFIFVGLNHIPKYWESVQSPNHPVFKLEREWKQRR